MPAYNGMPMIKASVMSLINQTYKDWECIIVDDGSTDGTSAYLDTLPSLDSRFVIHHFEQNQGRPKARQKTLELSRGKYIAMLDAEDLMSPDRLEIQMAVLEKHPEIALVTSNMCSFGTKTNLTRIRGTQEFRILDFDGSNYPNHAASMILGDEARKFEYNPLMKLGQDSDFLQRYLKGKKFAEMPNMMYYYSEFDSVSKHKIKRTYKLNMQKAWQKHNVYAFVRALLQYTYALCIYPFISTKTIIKKRGRVLTDEQVQQFQKDCLNIVNKVMQEV